MEPLLLAEKIGMGTWPDWVAAVGSVCAFGIVAFGLWRDRQHRREDRAETERQQARLVFASFEGLNTAPSGTGSIALVVVRNQSQEPIHEVTVRVGLKSRQDHDGSGTIPHVLGGTSHQADIAIASNPHMQSSSNVEVWIEFTDSRGARWMKRGLNQPARMT